MGQTWKLLFCGKYIFWWHLGCIYLQFRNKAYLTQTLYKVRMFGYKVDRFQSEMVLTCLTW